MKRNIVVGLSLSILLFATGCGGNNSTGPLTTEKNSTQLNVITGCGNDTKELSKDIEENIPENDPVFKNVQKLNETFNKNDKQQIHFEVEDTDYYVTIKNCQLKEIREDTQDGKKIY